MSRSPVRKPAAPLCLLFLVIPALLFFASPRIFSTPETGFKTLLLSVNGTINPAVGDYIKKGFVKAGKQNSDLVIIQLDTPGGLDAAMRDIIQEILSSPVPVVTYVSPDGARAASAGTYILYASHLAAMAPATNLGAATPIQIGGLGSGQEQDGEGQDDKESEPHGSALQRKIINDASAYIRALAEKHGRNADWAVLAVQEAVSLTAKEALELNVINIVALDIDDLLEQLDGRIVTVNGEEILLATDNFTLNSFLPSWRYRLLGVIGDPNIAYLLLLLGFYGLIYELANPGFLLPGVAGGIALMLALYAFQVLPVNYSGLALILLGISFLVGEAFLPSFGTLGIGGIIAFSVGSLILVDDEKLRVSLPLIIGTTVVSAALVLVLAGRIALMRKKKVHTGREAMVGMIGEARADFDADGVIWLAGESWRAHSSAAVKKGDKVRILAIDGLDLKVEPAGEES